MRLTVCLVICLLPAVAAAQLAVTQLSPAPNALAAATAPVVRFDFDRPLDPATVTADHFSAFGRWTGPVSGSLQLTNGNQSVLFHPDRDFTAGDLVTVGFSDGLRGLDNSAIQVGGYNYQFWTRTRRVSSLPLNEIDTLSTGSPSRPYGGVATDLDNNGWLDITLVNEDSADLRVFMNREDGTGLFEDYAQPTYAVGNRASASEAADFNRDGFADIAVADINDNTISVLLGNGDGSFAPRQTIPVGFVPRGIATLDIDGDGDTDVVNTNRSSNNLSVHINDGNGVFGTPTNIDGGIAQEWSLMSADMNNDGRLDLVTAAGQIRVLTANGDGSFTQQPLRATGGNSWQIALGDVNGDGIVDVASANAQSNTGSILMGNGDGTFQAADIYNVANMGSGGNGFPLATDLGDIDGDGDLDWITSSFNGDWILQLNDGDGNFTFAAQLPAPTAASCSLMHDFDNDGDLDLGLIDEIANVLVLTRNDGAHVLDGDFDADGDLDGGDVDALVMGIAAGEDAAFFDITGDGYVNTDDLEAWLTLGGAQNLPSGEAYLLGDANLDGTVDGQDFLAWNQQKFTATAAWTAGDFNADGIVDGLDFVIWNQSKFQTAAAVPEPLSHGLWGLGLVWCLQMIRKPR